MNGLRRACTALVGAGDTAVCTKVLSVLDIGSTLYFDKKKREPVRNYFRIAPYRVQEARSMYLQTGPAVL